ncbi:MAG: DUF29 domain-containing protein [Bacteroidales bacterium]|nr:DUF29 domain-containing protein [Bacteroidales bacterium]
MDDTPRTTRARYDDDAYGWAFEQAALLRAGRWSDLDIEHLADEIESVGRTEADKLESALRLVLMHLLKWDYQPEKRTRSWTITIANQRDRATKFLQENRSLKPRLGDIIADAYRLARREASGETDLDLSIFPETCPWSFDDIMTRPVEWPPVAG